MSKYEARARAWLVGITATAAWATSWYGCKASVNGDAKSESGDIKEESPATPAGNNIAVASLPSIASAGPTTAFIGVTASLTLAPDVASRPVCRCLAAVVGPPASSGFVWQGAPPYVGPDATVVAIGGTTTPCDKPTGGRGPSIRGVTQEEGNVVVTLEEGRQGIPLARGAVVPMPNGGDVVFRSVKGLPYAHGLTPGDAASGCRVRPAP